MKDMHVPHLRPTSLTCVLVALAILSPLTSLGFNAITLTSQDFESKTQAATGQTTGIWCVVLPLIPLFSPG